MESSKIQPKANEPVARPIRFLTFFICTILFLFSANILLSAINIGRMTDKSKAVCHNIESRVALGNAMRKSKLVIIGGSSVRRGFSAHRIAEHFGIQTLNFGMLAAMGPELTLHEARKVLKTGDTALLSLEYSQYAVASWNPVSLDVLYSCSTDYFWQMPVSRKFEALLAVSPLRLTELTESIPLPRYNAVTPTTNETPAATYGDLPLDTQAFPPLSSQERRRVALYRPMTIVLERNSAGTSAIAEFAAWARAHGIKVVATWPNTIGFKAYDTMQGLADIRAFYSELGVPVIGKPSLGFYSSSLFYDTQYHLTPAGIIRRTDDFIAELERNRSFLPNGDVIGVTER